MIVFGGHVEPGPFVSEIWVLENANGLGGAAHWIAISTSGVSPKPREWHSAVHDTANNRIIVFGGTSELGTLNAIHRT
jgi:hypothetical protein